MFWIYLKLGNLNINFKKIGGNRCDRFSIFPILKSDYTKTNILLKYLKGVIGF